MLFISIPLELITGFADPRWEEPERLSPGNKPQVSPLRCAPVETTKLWPTAPSSPRDRGPLLNHFVVSTGAYPDFPLRDAGKITYAALRIESRMELINATGLNGKSGGAQWTDLRSSSHCFFSDGPLPGSQESNFYGRAACQTAGAGRMNSRAHAIFVVGARASVLARFDFIRSAAEAPSSESP